MFDAQGMTIVPGFIDCHNHPVGETLLYEVAVGNPFDVEFVTIASILDKLSAKARQTPPGYWVSGFFYDDTKVKDKRPLNIQRPGQGVEGSPGGCSASWRTHHLLQQQGVRARGHHSRYARSSRRDIRPRRQRKS